MDDIKRDFGVQTPYKVKLPKALHDKLEKVCSETIGQGSSYLVNKFISSLDPEIFKDYKTKDVGEDAVLTSYMMKFDQGEIVDEIAKKHGLTRSDILREAIEIGLENLGD